MATIRRFEDLQAWQKARELVREVYKTSAHGSLSRDFGLKDQLCRAAVSAMSTKAVLIAAAEAPAASDAVLITVAASGRGPRAALPATKRAARLAAE